MRDVNKEVSVFYNAADKIRLYNSHDRICKGGRYNAAYHKILTARGNSSSLVDREGDVNENSIVAVEKGLLAFDMGRQMDSRFKGKLLEKLSKDKVRALLKEIRQFSILSANIEELQIYVEDLFNDLRAAGPRGLSSRPDQFTVGATKIMNFLFPELLVIADSNVRKGLRKAGYLDFEKYWSIMMICHQEVGKWQEHSTLESLIQLDTQPTTAVRIFDKCAFVMGRFESRV